MLVLDRKTAESVVIDGGRVRITVLSAARGRVRLGIAADPDIVVDREEIHERKLREQKK